MECQIDNIEDKIVNKFSNNFITKIKKNNK